MPFGLLFFEIERMMFIPSLLLENGWQLFSPDPSLTEESIEAIPFLQKACLLFWLIRPCEVGSTAV